MKCKHKWTVVGWKHNYAGISSLKTESVTAETLMCQLCEKTKKHEIQKTV